MIPATQSFLGMLEKVRQRNPDDVLFISTAHYLG